MNTTSTPNALEGVRVVDLSRLVAGNMISHVLADFGADVIKVERPGHGDDLRNWTEEGVSVWWKAYARNKRSVAWDLKDSEEKQKLIRLIASAQVLIENFVPGKLSELGLAPELLWETNPSLIIAHVSGWGQSGPYKDRPGFGTLVEGMSGFAHINGFPDKPPALPPLATADMIAGLYGAFAVMAALRHVEQQGGKGQEIDVCLFESMFSFVASEPIKHRVTGKVSERMGNHAINTAPRNVYQTSDGQYLSLSGSVQSMCERLLRVIGRPELIEDPRFKTNEDRVRNREALDDILAEFIGQRSLEENLALFEREKVTVGPVLSVEQLLEHPYVLGRQVISEFPDSELGSIPAHTPLPRMTATPAKIRSEAPMLGEHTAEIESELNS